MWINEVTLPSASPEDLGRWYANLGFVVSSAASDTVRVRLGRSTLHLVPGPTPTGSHHLAYSVPSAALGAAGEQVSGHAELFERDGAHQFHFDPPFGPADSVYFQDPDGSLIEFIGRELPHPFHGFDASRDVISIAEAAVPVESVPSAVADLREIRGLSTVLDGPEFASVGDHHGMLIIVPIGRTWFPTDHLTPTTAPLDITIDAPGARYDFSYGTVLT
jgi:catechol 2,3-dioxygenase-like lactoylglutathione lyase family enzyme